MPIPPRLGAKPMNINEFRTRTEKFLSAEEINQYEVDFEPAYMNAEAVNKDDFCAALKDKNTRVLIVALSHALTSVKMKLENAHRAIDMVNSDKRDLHEKNAKLQHALAVISSTVDRALA